jgi:hypothetical protein
VESLPIFFREKAAQCRRLADLIANRTDPAVAALLAMADDFDRRAEPESSARVRPNQPRQTSYVE